MQGLKMAAGQDSPTKPATYSEFDDVLTPPDFRAPADKASIGDFIAPPLEYSLRSDSAESKGYVSDGSELWPTEKYNDSPERKFNKRFAIVRFLTRVWKPFIEQSGAAVTVSILAKIDENAGNAFYSYLSRRPMPDELQGLILTSAELRKEMAE